MQAIVNGLETLRRLTIKLGPYMLLELLLPGGTLFALLLFLYRQQRLAGVATGARAAIVQARAGSPEHGYSGLQRRYLGRSQAFYARARQRLESKPSH